MVVAPPAPHQPWDADPKYENDLRCVNHSLESWNNGIRRMYSSFCSVKIRNPVFIYGLKIDDVPNKEQS